MSNFSTSTMEVTTVVESLPVTQIHPEPESIKNLRQIADSVDRSEEVGILDRVSKSIQSTKTFAEAIKSSDISSEEFIKSVKTLNTWLVQSHMCLSVNYTHSTSDNSKVYVSKTYCIDEDENFLKGIARIKSVKLTKSQINTLYLRQHGNNFIPVSFGILASIPMMAALGRLNNIDEVVVTSKGVNSQLARALVAGYDLLEVSRANAMKAMTSIMLHAHQPIIDFSILSSKLYEISWVHEGAVKRLQQSFQRAASDISSAPQARKELLSFVNRIKLAPSAWLLEDISSMNTAHVAGIAILAGINVDPAFKKNRLKLQGMLSDAGIASDYKLVLPLGEVALKKGLETPLKNAIARRASGDVYWDKDLVPLLN